MALIEAVDVLKYSPAATSLLQLMQSGVVYPLPCMSDRRFSIIKPITRTGLVIRFWEVFSKPIDVGVKLAPYDPEIENACEQLLNITCTLAEITGVSPASIGLHAHKTLMVDMQKNPNLLRIEPYVYAAKMLGDHYVSSH